MWKIRFFITICAQIKRKELVINMKNQIINILSKTPTLPVLFVGAGISRRYLNLPDWKGLLQNLASNLSQPFSYYMNKAEEATRSNPDMLFPFLADYIEHDYNDEWYTNPTFEINKNIHKNETDLGMKPFKISIAEFFRTQSTNFLPEYEEEINKFKEIGNKHISSIITTNYDLFIENCFGDKNFQTFIGQNELLFSPLMELAELYKIHGCCTDPNSIIINSYDYNKFIEKSSYLSAKLLTIFLENPIIFIGYGLNDPNIKRILESISNCLENNQLEKLKERLIFVEWNNTSEPDKLTEKTFTFPNGKNISMQGIYLSDYSILYDAILANKVQYEVKYLRRIKRQLYELVRTNQPTQKLYIATSLDDVGNDVDFVVGVGVYGKFGQVGYRGLQLNELYRYVLGLSELQYDDNMILQQSIPELFNGKSTLPVCKLISNCNDISFISNRAKESMVSNLKDMLSDSQKDYIEKNYFDMDGVSIKIYYKLHNLSQTLAKIPLLNPSEINIDDLYSFICEVIENDSTLLSIDRTINNQSNSALRKCISIWDWLKYHNAAKRNIKNLEAK